MTKYTGWKVEIVGDPPRLWFSDGSSVTDVRGGSDLSSRLIVDGQGFLDITDLRVPPNTISIYLNGQEISAGSDELWITIGLGFSGKGLFTAKIGGTSTTGKLKPFPNISIEDITFIRRKIEEKYIPYQNIPDAPGKTVKEIERLGRQFFPFTSHSFELAMCVYDWTTASFVRMVLCKVFEYTGVPPSPLHPLNKSEVANMIWLSNWRSYNPRDKYYMNSFMMRPAHTLDDVKLQLAEVAPALREISDVENRLLSAAVLALPRTSIFSKRRLYSGQLDIYQFGLDRFGTEFLECPLNKGPVTDSMTIPFELVINTYVSPGSIITTKMFWAFTDTVEDALHYSSGILIIANPPHPTSRVWDTVSHITPLSDDSEKTEYIFPPRSRFRVLEVEKTTANGKPLTVINLTPIPDPQDQEQDQNVLSGFESDLGRLSLQQVEALHPTTFEEEVRSNIKDGKLAPPEVEAHIHHKTGGRWCRCAETIKASIP